MLTWLYKLFETVEHEIALSPFIIATFLYYRGFQGLMSSKDRVTLPSSGGGLMRYFDDYKSKVNLQPGHIIILVIVIIIIEIVLHQWGYGFLGL